MSQVLTNILKSAAAEEKLLAVLIDPDKFKTDSASEFLRKIPRQATHILVGGSRVENGRTEACVKALKAETQLPVILFPGDHSHITGAADALFFLSLLSGRNPEFLIGQQVRSVNKIRQTQLEIIPTGYILVDGGKECAVHHVSKTSPLSPKDPETIVNTALAGEYSGKGLVYLEAGSGAKFPVSAQIISLVKKAISVPLIVGGGIRSAEALSEAYTAGADMVVVGTAFENDDFFLS